LAEGKANSLRPQFFSILFEAGNDGKIAKVVISTDLFGTVDLGELDETKPMPARPLSFDKDSAMTWATYVMGYVDGSMWARQPDHGAASAGRQDWLCHTKMPATVRAALQRLQTSFLGVRTTADPSLCPG